MTDLLVLRTQILDAAEHEHDQLKRIAANMARNLKIMASDYTETFPAQREAAKIALANNYKLYERAKDKLAPAE